MTDEAVNTETKQKRTVIGTVVSCKMQKTIVVKVDRKVKHAVYGKYVRSSSKMYAHNENQDCQVGDLVLIEQTRPLSKTKHWKLVEILKKMEEQQ